MCYGETAVTGQQTVVCLLVVFLFPSFSFGQQRVLNYFVCPSIRENLSYIDLPSNIAWLDILFDLDKGSGYGYWDGKEHVSPRKWRRSYRSETRLYSQFCH